MNDGMVQLNKVTKAYGSFQLDCSMEVQPGMATGFVGANGAGKTTILRSIIKQLKPLGGVVVLDSVFADGKISILTMATKDAVAKGIHAGNIVKEVARICGGGGGGRPDMAQAGGKDASKLGEALEAAWGVIETQVK